MVVGDHATYVNVALRADRLNGSTYMARQNIVVSSIMMLVAIILFVVHWRWLRAASLGGIAKA